MSTVFHLLTLAVELSDEQVLEILASEMHPYALAKRGFVDHWLAIAFACLSLVLAIRVARNKDGRQRHTPRPVWSSIPFFLWGLGTVGHHIRGGFGHLLFFQIHTLGALFALAYILILWLATEIVQRKAEFGKTHWQVHLHGIVVAAVIASVFADLFFYVILISPR